MKMRFIGTEAEILGVVKLNKFGQEFELPEESITASFLGSLPAIPDDTFGEIGFTAEELKKYANPGPRNDPDEEFADKWFAARMALHEFREHLQEGK